MKTSNFAALTQTHVVIIFETICWKEFLDTRVREIDVWRKLNYGERGGDL
jgi:hypothetical protein